MKISYHQSALLNIDWDGYTNALKKLTTFQGSEEMQAEMAQTISQFVDGNYFFFVSSGSAALELAVLSLGLSPGDEIITPSFTFSACPNAIIRGGGTPVFCEVQKSNLHVHPLELEALITPRTRAIMVVDYAGMRCDLRPIKALCEKYGLALIEDAAQAFGAPYVHAEESRYADFVCYSFHDTKNISCGEGGLLVVKDKSVAQYTEIIFEKGTNRKAFLHGQVDKYSWKNAGGSFIMSDANLLLLDYQLRIHDEIARDRRAAFKNYVDFFTSHDFKNEVWRPLHPDYGNGHIFWLAMPDGRYFKAMYTKLAELGVQTPTHYVPLHSSDFAMQSNFSASENMQVTDVAGHQLLRLSTTDLVTSNIFIEQFLRAEDAL